MNDIVENYIRLIDTADSVDKISEITNRAAWDVALPIKSIAKYMIMRLIKLEIGGK